jgi:hypothetical protein
MIIRQTPSNKEKYIIVDSETSNILYMSGFNPKYIDNKYIYYVKNERILTFMEREGLKCQNI